MQRVIGIDFGTSTTYMNVKRYNGNQPVEDAFSYMPVMFNYGESSGYVATIIRENADGTFDFGKKAAEEMDGSKIYTEIKMQLEHPDETQRNEARRVVKEFFKFLYATYFQQAANLGSDGDEEETVISYPVKWQAETAEFMLEAAREAGFKNVRGMDEATAAISTVLCHHAGKDLVRVDRPGYLLLVDMGAGTTDLVVCKYQADAWGKLKVELVNTWPRDAQEPCFGGREVDRVLERYVEAYLSESLKPEMAAFAHGLACTPGAAKKWKELNVSVSLAANKPVTTCAYAVPPYIRPSLSSGFPAFGRPEFEEFARQGLMDYVRLLEGCLTDTARTDADFEAAGVDLVILTGGHSSWYFAREIVDGTMEGYLAHPALTMVREKKDHVVNLPNPQTTVSLGLVYSKLPFDLKKQEIVKTEPLREVDPPKKVNSSEAVDSIVKVAQDVLSKAPDLRASNVVQNAERVRVLRGTYHLTDSETVLYAHENGEMLWTDKGIYQQDFSSVKVFRDQPIIFMPWKEFAGSTVTEDNDTRRIYTCNGNSILTTGMKKNREGMRALYNALRKHLGLAFDDRAESCLWDPRLLPIVKQFVLENQILRSKGSCMQRYQPAELLVKLELGDRVGDEIYHASDDYTLSILGRNKCVITSSGFAMRWHYGILGYGGDFVTWEEFMETDLTDASSEVVKTIKAMGVDKDFITLQQLLRQEAAKLD